MLQCVACWCVSDSERGWFGFVAEDPEDDEGAVVGTYCPPCAERELEVRQREPGYL